MFEGDSLEFVKGSKSFSITFLSEEDAEKHLFAVNAPGGVGQLRESSMVNAALKALDGDKKDFKVNGYNLHVEEVNKEEV